MCSPVLRPDTWVAYTRALHLTPTSDENQATSELPQFYADRFGWQEMTDQVVAAYHSLSPADQARVCLSNDNYGEAGAIDFLGKRAEPNLPPAISRHNTYWMWGMHGCDANLVIAVTDASLEDLQKVYRSVQIVGRINTPGSPCPRSNKNIYLMRDRKADHPVAWGQKKNYF